MKITLKFYSSLSDFLPDDAKKNVGEMDFADNASAQDVVNRLGIAMKMVHLTLVNGVYVAPSDLAAQALKEGDTLAMWPPLAGG
ncbi:MAG: molybdopterin synthase sulfur carrier subunit [Rhodospirillaceae bacterium]|nr:MAG: molybdopterin synthase sulfur carrier subunit [Rhodospirillaceae bacterium]